jgi:hypothetical protein
VIPQNIKALLDLLIQLKIELYDEVAEHCQELAQPLQEFINQVDAVDDLGSAICSQEELRIQTAEG